MKEKIFKERNYKSLLSLMFALAMVIAFWQMSDMTVYADETTHTCAGGKGVENATAITSKTDLEDLFSQGGSGYLVDDITLSDYTGTVTVAPGKEVNLCLNGKMLKVTSNIANSRKRVIFINGTLNLYDCDTTTTRHWESNENGLWTQNDTGNYTTTGGVITGGTGHQNSTNDGYEGGAIYVNTNATLNMYGGNIVGNTTRTGDGPQGHGAGVCVYTNATFNMYGGRIAGNCGTSNGNTVSAGGAVFIRGGVMTLSGNAQIDHNTVTGSGGAIFNQGTFTMTGGTIENNVAKTNSAIVIYSANNETSLLGGKISNNETKCTETGLERAAVFVSNSVKVGGNIVINDNHNASAESKVECNLGLKSGALLAIDSENPLITGADIGISPASPVSSLPISLSGSNSADYSSYLNLDNKLKEELCIATATDNSLIVKHRADKWIYQLSSENLNSITATCSAHESDADCIYKGPKTLYIKEPSSSVYNGEAKSARLTDAEDNNLTNFLGEDLPAITYKYKKTSDGTYRSTTDRTKAGCYKASITLGGQTASIEYTIAPNVKIADGIRNGTVSVDKPDATEGQTVTITATPNWGYKLREITVTDANGTEITATKTDTNEYEFTMPADSELIPVTVNASFSATSTTPTLRGTVSITGTATYGQILTADTSSLINTGSGTLSYVWKRGNDVISGAKENTYTLTADDIGKTITVTVTSSVARGSVTSSSTSAVEKADGPAAPVVSGVACTTISNNDGKITGTTAEMEYSTSDTFDSVKTCSATETTGLANGTYYVRLKETATTKAGTAVKVTIAAYKASDDSNKGTAVTSKEKEANALTLNKGLKVSQTGKKIKIRWGQVKKADGYQIYAAYCGNKLGNPLKTIKSSNVTSVNITKIKGKALNKKKNYKVCVVAYKLVAGKKVTIGKTIMAHVVGAKNATYSNAKSIRILSAKSLKLKVGKTSKIKAKTILVNKSKKQLGNAHAREFRYASSNKSVCTVSKKGKITAKKAGTCYVYVYSRNGYAKRVKVTVK